MWNKIIDFFRAPIFRDDEEKTHAAALLNSTVLSISAATLLYAVLARDAVFSRLLTTVVPLLLLQAGLLILIRRGNIRMASTGLVAGLWLILVHASYINGGVRAPAFSGIIVIVMIAGFLLGTRPGLLVAGLSVAAGLWLILLEDRGVLPTPVILGPFTILLAQITYFIVVIVLLGLATRSIRQALARARLNEERYRLIASVMSDYAFSIRYAPDGKIAEQWLSGAFEAITGYTADEFIARGGWTSIVHPDDGQQDADDMAQLRANQKVVTEIRLIRKDGDVRWVRSYGHPVWDDQLNQLAGIYGAVQDITVSKQAENNLLHREAILEIVADAANLFLKVSNWTIDIWHEEVNNLLKRLGTTIKASHAYVFENGLAEDSSTLMSMKYEWTAPGFTSDLSNPKYKNVPIRTGYLENWNHTINRGVPYIGDVKHVGHEDMKELGSRQIYALLDVPIFVDGKWWGTIGFDDMTYAREWSTAEVGALVVAANLLGATIQRRQTDLVLQNELQQRKTLIDELEAKNAEAETLRESVAIVASTLERSEAINRILEQLELVVPYKSASVQLLDGDMLEIVSARGFDLESDGAWTKFKVNENEPAYSVLREYVPYILFDDVQSSIPAFNESPHNNIHTWMAVPLKVKGKIIGIIALDGERVGQFSERDAKLAVTYANQVAIALENASLFSKLQIELSARQKLIDELEAKNAELERFTYTVSHDLRSPLVTIKGFLGFMEKDANAGNMESFRRDMLRVGSATDRMDNLLKGVLEISRTGRLVNKPQEVPFADLVNEALEIVHGRIQQRGITVHTQPGLPIVYGDRQRLTEVLQNLLDNAAKYMGDQKDPRIEIGMNGYDDSKNPIFFVRDNGMGIDSQHHESIFGIFDKLDATSEGTGIGLALVKRIIEFHGGRIWVESEMEKGTTFYFTLAGISQ